MSAKPTQNVVSQLSPQIELSEAHCVAPNAIDLRPSVSGIATLIRQRLLERLPEMMTAEDAASYLMKSRKSWRRFCRTGAGPKSKANGRGRGAKLQYAREDLVDALARCLSCTPEPPNGRQ